MKKYLFCILMLIGYSSIAQTNSSEETPEKFVENFFEAFHDQDTIRLKQMAHQEARLQSVSKDKAGKTVLVTEEYGKFIKGIASIPPDAEFKETIHEFRVEENGLMATVNTPYSFHFNGKFSHCGVNTFQLVKFEGEWRIVYLIDTREKEGCD
ncbi:nuclear transport factor 2 family protein [Christiangramia aquimixticola]|uniref:nuclear transport factor 2 family protein n=1 Tax=Christiangramia aquimixticola TaxID=1697558 RepID=UPI003AA99B0F